MKSEEDDQIMSDHEETTGQENTEAAKKPVSKQRAKKAMSATLQIVRKLGTGAGDLWKRLRKSKTPQEMLDELGTGLDANRARRESVSARVEELHGKIAAKKKEHAAAGKARQRILEAELRSMLTEYKAAERELNVLLENERVLSQVRGRMNEMLAYDMAGIGEDFIDDVAVDIEDRVADAEGRMDASRDLEKAGRRRERESDREDLWDALGEFDDAPVATADSDAESGSTVDISEELKAFDLDDDESPVKEPEQG